MATHTLKKISWYVFNCYFNYYYQNQKYTITREPWFVTFDAFMASKKTQQDF